MATIVTDPYSQMADAIEAAVLTEFDDLTYLTVVHDRIHESLGSDGRYWVGISPDDEPSGGIDMSITATIQFYGPFHPDVDPFQQVDPRDITNKAERLRRALADVRTTGTPHVWFFDVVTTRYPEDATGNKTRFEMTVTGRGNNSGLVETTG